MNYSNAEATFVNIVDISDLYIVLLKDKCKLGKTLHHQLGS